MKRYLTLVVALGALSRVASSQAPERAVFLVRLGPDTLAVESASIGASTADATLWLRNPIMRIQRTLVIADGIITRATMQTGLGVLGDSLARRVVISLARDSAVTQRLDTSGAVLSASQGAAPRGAVPYVNLSGQSLELILRRARALGGESVSVPLTVGGSQPLYATVSRRGADSVVVQFAGVELRVRTDSTGRMLGAGVPSQGVVFERLAGDSPAAVWRPARVSYAAPAGAPYRAEAVTVRTAGQLTLAGTLTLPPRRGSSRLPAVILITGSGSQDRDETLLPGFRPFREIADTLSRRGIAVLRLDDRGVGESNGSPVGATSADLADDIRSAVAWLRARPDIDPARVGLVGHSEGAIIAPMLAATDRRLRALALIAGPASRGGELLAYQRRYHVEHDTSVAPARRDSVLASWNRVADSLMATREGVWYRFFASYDPLVAARAVRAPTLILQGETDAQVPVAEAVLLAAAMRRAGNRSVTVRTFPRMNHLMLEDASGDPRGYSTLSPRGVRRDLLGALADWLSRTL